jgi:multidrug efflux pump subunit AcrA (membrane-fusion protein)
MLTRNRKILLLGVVVVATVISTLPEFVQKFRAEELHQDSSAAAAQGSWETVTLGRVEPRSGEIKVGAAVPGRIADVLVKANDDVFAGELLVRLDDAEALARVAEADAQVALHKRAQRSIHAGWIGRSAKGRRCSGRFRAKCRGCPIGVGQGYGRLPAG